MEELKAFVQQLFSLPCVISQARQVKVSLHLLLGYIVSVVLSSLLWVVCLFVFRQIILPDAKDARLFVFLRISPALA